MPRGWQKLPDEDPAKTKGAKPSRRSRFSHHKRNKDHSSKPQKKESEQQKLRSQASFSSSGSGSRSREIKLPFDNKHKQWAYRKYYYIGYRFDDPKMKGKLIKELERQFHPEIDDFYFIIDKKSVDTIEMILPESAMLHDGTPKGCFDGYTRVPYVWLVANNFYRRHKGNGIEKLPNPFDDEEEKTLVVGV